MESIYCNKTKKDKVIEQTYLRKQTVHQTAVLAFPVSILLRSLYLTSFYLVNIFRFYGKR